MHNHEPEKHICPFCLIVKGIENEHVYTKQADVVYQDDWVTAFISSHWWMNNPGHVIIIPNDHVENLYDISDDLLQKITVLSKRIAIAMKGVYGCEGITLRQHNEPAGNQEVWHFHIHVFPRYENDQHFINDATKRLVEPEERIFYANKLKKYFKNQ